MLSPLLNSNFLFQLSVSSANEGIKLPAPKYELAVGGLKEIESKSGFSYTFGKLMYAPRYPVYTFPDANDNLDDSPSEPQETSLQRE